METRMLYNRILAVANYFLINAKLFSISIDALQEFDPSVSAIAKNMSMLANILKELAADNYDDESMAINAFQCCLIMERIANIVASGNEEALEKLVKDLELHVRAP